MFKIQSKTSAIRILLILLAIVCLTFAASFALDQSETMPTPALGADSVTSEQDASTLYKNNCMRCHGNTNLVFDGFHDKYASEAALKSYISSTMPKSSPGSLSDVEYTALATYIYGLNPKKQPPPQPVKRKLAIVGKRIYLDGKELRLTSEPQTVNSKLMVPFRPIFEAFQLRPGWNSTTRTISGSNSQFSLRLTINNTNAVVNGRTVRLDVAPRIRGGATLVPIRFVAETLGLQVDYRAK